MFSALFCVGAGCGWRLPINYDLAIGGGKIVVASEIHDVSLHFTTGASGKGGENAVYSYELDRTNGDLTQKITINLVQGQCYSDDQIQKLIDNAKVTKEFEAAAGKVYFSSSHGVIRGADAETYGIKTGKTNQQMSVSTASIGAAKSIDDANIDDSGRKTINTSVQYTVAYVKNGTKGAISISGTTINISTGANNTNPITNTLANANTLLTNIRNKASADAAKKNTDSSGNFYVDTSGAKVNDGNCTVTSVTGGSVGGSGNSRTIAAGTKITVNKTVTQCVATISSQSAYNFTLTADKPGSYSEYVADEEKYKQPDVEGVYNMKALSGLTVTTSDSATDNISLSVDDSGAATVTLKKGYTATGNEIATQIENLLRDDGYEYSVTAAKNSATFEPDATGLNSTIKVEYVNNDPDFVAGDGSASTTITTAGERMVKRVGTISGVRQELSGDLTSLMISPGSGTEDSSDQIKFTANSYGAANDYDSIVGIFKISTNPTLAKGEERVDVKEEVATIHLATGTRYTNHDIERLLKNAGLNYTVELTDNHNPDGDYDGSVYFNTTGEINVAQTVAGQGLGIEDISDIKDQLEFQIGANGVEDQKVGMDLIDASAKSLGVDSVDVSTQEGANRAIELIDDAIKKVSTFRADMGALQNRMEHSVNSLNVSNENLTAAESQIRDTDMAAEMVKYTRNNILQQASQSMLAQANHQSDGILSMLQ